MHIHPIVLDFEPAYFTRAACTLLEAPLGVGKVIDYVRAALEGLPVEPLRVLPAGQRRATGQRAAPLSDLIPLDDSCKPADLLLLIDARFLPVAGRRYADLAALRFDAPFAQNIVLLDRASRGANELIQEDDRGHVRRIRRYYDGVTYLRSQGAAAILMPVAMAQLIERVSVGALDDLRSWMAAQGLPAHDLPVSGGLVDMLEPANFLEFSEHEVRRLCARPDVPPGYRRLPGGGLAAESADVRFSAIVRGPVILRDAVVIAEQAAVLGPALIGAEACVGRASRVVQSVVLPGVHISGDSCVLQAVIAEDPAESGAAVPPATLAFRRARAVQATAAPPTGAAGSPSSSSRYPAIKAVIEGLMAGLGLLVLSPLLLFTAIAVRLESRGPIFFGHVREGRDGKPFRCWKFRTMVDGADRMQRKLRAESQNQVDGPQFKLARDPRATLIGRLLRSTNIDELPQLFNVLRGQMSLIGPRPSPFVENQICVAWRKQRLSVRPGITGLWQVCREDRAASDFHQWIYYDMLYVKHISPWLDAKILLATVLTVGGRWPAPLHWLIPRRLLHADMHAALDGSDDSLDGDAAPVN